MSFIPEESQKEKEMREKLEAEGVLHKRKPRESSEPGWYQRYVEREQERKIARQAWLERQTELNRQKEDKPKIEMGSIPDTPITPTGTATATIIRGLGSYAGAALSAGARKVRDMMKKRREERAKKAAKAAEEAEEASKAQRERTQAAMAQSTRLLPPARPFMTGKEKKTAISQGRYLGHNEVSEEFSCWREEFLYELGEMRRNKKQKERIIDVMKGKNKITIGPNESETGINEGRTLSWLKTTVKKIAQKAEIPLLTTSFVLSAGQSPEAFIRSGHNEGPGIAGMQRLTDPKKTPKHFLDLKRVSHSARNKKLEEELSREELLKAIVLKLINEKKRKNSLLNNQYIGEETAAWTRKEGKNPTGGLNKKGVASYRRENPGSNLQTAVTTPPSKLKPNSKAAKRRKSFCARMSGMPGPMKDEKGRPTRKALSLRKWNC